MATPQTGLTSCQIGDMGHPGTVRGNPRHIHCTKDYPETSQVFKTLCGRTGHV